MLIPNLIMLFCFLDLNVRSIGATINPVVLTVAFERNLLLVIFFDFIISILFYEFNEIPKN